MALWDLRNLKLKLHTFESHKDEIFQVCDSLGFLCFIHSCMYIYGHMHAGAGMWREVGEDTFKEKVLSCYLEGIGDETQKYLLWVHLLRRLSDPVSR